MADLAPLFENSFTASKRIIHTPSRFAKTSLLYLQETGELSAILPHTSSRACLPSFLFFVVTDGKGKLEYKGQTYELTQGDCVFIDCRNGYSQGTSDSKDESGKYNELWRLSWVHFDGSAMPAIYSKYKERGGKAVFHCSAPARYAALVQAVFSIASSDSYVRDMQIAEKLTRLLTLLMEDAWTQENGVQAAPKRKLVCEVKAYIDESFKEQMALSSLAEKFYINKEYLSKIFKEEYGFTVNGYICHVRVTKAKELLRFTDMTIEEIALETGVADANYFSRMFKKVEGVSPGRYRESW